MDLQIISKLELFFSYCGTGGRRVEEDNIFLTGPFRCQLTVCENRAETQILLTLKIPCFRDDIFLRLLQSLFPESNFGVVSSVFLVNNCLTLSCLLPVELETEDWYRIFEYQKKFILSFLE